MDRAGVYRIEDGEIVTITAIGDLNPIEFNDVAATADRVAPLAALTGGSVSWLADGLPRLRRTAPDRPAEGSGWIGLKEPMATTPSPAFHPRR